jgi:ABC-2 type transport system ATP-binding protein
VAIVNGGRIVAEGPPRELVAGAAAYRVAFDRGGEHVEMETDDPTQLLHDLTSEALGRGQRLENLRVAQPTLEEVYLDLTAEAQ